jgi:hypothetical protein
MLFDHFADAEGALLRKKKSQPDTKSTLAARAQKKLYPPPAATKKVLKKDSVVLPTQCAWASIRDAGMGMALPGKRVFTKADKTTMLPAILSFHHDTMILLQGKAVPLTAADITADGRLGRMPKDKTACFIVRAMIQAGWLGLLHGRLNIEHVKGVHFGTLWELLVRGGVTQGLGGYRPSCGDTFGMYRPVQIYIKPVAAEQETWGGLNIETILRKRGYGKALLAA